MPCLMLQLYKKEISFNDPCVTKYLAFDFDTSVRSVQLHTRAIQLSRFSYIRSRRKKRKKNSKNDYMHLMFPIRCICIMPNRWWKGIVNAYYEEVSTSSSSAAGSIMLLLPYIIISQGRLVRALVHIEYSI